MILFRADAISRPAFQNSGKVFPDTDREDLNSPNESTISTPLIHNITSEGKPEQELTWILNHIFKT